MVLCFKRCLAPAWCSNITHKQNLDEKRLEEVTGTLCVKYEADELIIQTFFGKFIIGSGQVLCYFSNRVHYDVLFMKHCLKIKKCK